MPPALTQPEKPMSESPRVVMNGRSGFGSDLVEAARDLVGALRRWRLWTSLAMHDVAARYRGSMLGPLWITVTTAAMIAGVGLLYSQLFGLSTAEYIPWLATGIVFWTFFASCISEGCDVFIGSGAIIKQTALPMFTFLGRVFTRNLINFAHQILIVAAVVIYYGGWAEANPLMSLAGLLLVLVNLGWIVLMCGIISARFRDVPQIVTALVQVAMFLTPVFWRPEAIKSHRFMLDGNPFHHMLEVTRRPLLGESAALESYLFLMAAAIVGWIVAFVLFSRTRRRVVHFL
jgi:ABC-type polysaccharide/polyol phosphate export permease